MAKCILVLEDNAERRAAMRQRLAERMPMYELFVTDDPGEFVAALGCRPDVLAASLDHDLYDRPDLTTTITGMDVVDHLVAVEPAFPVLLHTTNERDGAVMRSRLRGAGWSVTWVKPFDGVTWVNRDWYPALKKAIRGAARRETLPPDADDRD